MEELDNNFIDEGENNPEIFDEVENYEEVDDKIFSLGESGDENPKNPALQARKQIFENLNIASDEATPEREKNFARRYYFKDIGQYPVLDGKTIKKLFKKYKPNCNTPENLKIRDAIVKSNLRLTYILSKNFYLGLIEEYPNTNIDLNDCILAGNMGLLYAIERYKHKESAEFSSFLRKIVFTTIYNWVRSNGHGFTSMPYGSAKRMRTLIENYRNTNGIEPSNPALAYMIEDYNDEHYNSFHPDYWQFYKYCLLEGTLSLDEPIEYGKNQGLEHATFRGDEVFSIAEEDEPQGEENFHEILKDTMIGPENTNNVEKQDIIKHVNADLKVLFSGGWERKYKVIAAYFGLDGNEPQSLDEIGQDLKLTPERVRQIKERAIRDIKRSKYRSTKFKGYLKDFNSLQ